MTDEQPSSPSPVAVRPPSFLGTILRNPATRALRHAWWTARAFVASAPKTPPDVQSILFVCKGNICRSPFAAAVARREFARVGLGHIRCLSAGFDPSQDRRSPDAAVAVAASHGIDLSRHVPDPIDTGGGTPDLVLVMEVAHLGIVERRLPELRDRIQLLPLYCPDTDGRRGYAQLNIADPFGRPHDEFERCYAHIVEAVRGLAEAVARAGSRPPASHREERVG